MNITEFKEDINDLLSLKKVNDNDNNNITVIMCTEALPWQCHRRIISECITVLGISVYNIIDY